MTSPPTTRLRAHGFFESVLADPQVELCARQPKPPRGFRFVPPALLQDLGNRGAFEGAQVRGVGARGPGGRVQRQVLCVDRRALAENRGPLQDITQLSDVARPGILEERLAGLT